MKPQKIWILFLCCAFLLGGCAEKREEAQKMLETQKEKNRYEMTTFAMDTVMDFNVYHDDGEELLIDAEQEIRRLERLLSVTIKDSDISVLNQNAGLEKVKVSEDTMDLLEKSILLEEKTGGAFNIALAPVVKAWGFTTEKEKQVPPQNELEGLLLLSDSRDIRLNKEDGTAYLEKAGMSVDLGGVAKGYASDTVTQLLRQKGVTSALFSLGGNISAIGKKSDGNDWKIAVENPLDAQDYVGLLEVRDAFVVTSGGYQRYFEQDGKKYHHIIDAKTGYPADNGLLSVTIINQEGTLADAYSTALFVMGLEKALDFWRNENSFEAIFVTTDGRVIATEGIADKFVFEGRDNDFIYEVQQK